MPNHVHAVIVISDDIDADPTMDSTMGAGVRPAPTPAHTPTPTNDAAPTPPRRQPLSEIVRALKSFSARQINLMRQTPGVTVWQRNYYEHIIRNKNEYQKIHFYIESNPARWATNAENHDR